MDNIKNRKLQNFYLPEHLGRVTHLRFFDSPLFVFKIEDASFGMNTQPALVQILQYLHKEFDARLICTEGAYGDFIDFSKLRSKLTAEQRARIDIEFAEGNITGAEYLSMTSELPLIMHGVENQEQYRAHTDALRQTNLANHFPSFLKKLRQRINVLKSPVYSEELYIFDQALEKFDARELSLHDFSGLIRSCAERTQVRLENFPNFTIFLNALRLEDEADFRKVEEERSTFIRDLVEKLDTPNIPITLLRKVVQAKYEYLDSNHFFDASESLSSKSAWQVPASELVSDYKPFANEIRQQVIDLAVKHRTGQVPQNAFYDFLMDVSALLNMNMYDYPNLIHYAHYLHHAQLINAKKMQEEMEICIQLIHHGLCIHDDEKGIAKISRALDGFYKLCSLQMTPRTNDLFKREFGQLRFTEFMQEKFVQETLSADEKVTLTEALQTVKKFLQKDEESLLRIFDWINLLQDSAEAGSDFYSASTDQELAELSLTELLEDKSNLNQLLEQFPISFDSLEDEIFKQILDEVEYSEPDIDAFQQSVENTELSLHDVLQQLAIELNVPIDDVIRQFQEEVPIFDSETPEFLTNLKSDSLLRGIILAEMALQGGYRFTQLSPARGRSLVENTLRYMQEQGATVGVLISGGFLTSQMLPVLEREQISYMVIMPQAEPSKITSSVWRSKFSKGASKKNYIQELLQVLNSEITPEEHD